MRKNSSIFFTACCIDDWGWEGMAMQREKEKRVTEIFFFFFSFFSLETRAVQNVDVSSVAGLTEVAVAAADTGDASTAERGAAAVAARQMARTICCMHHMAAGDAAMSSQIELGLY